MKCRSLVVLALFFIVAGIAKAQMPTYSLSIENSRVVGNELRFDIYMENTSINNIYVGECDFVLSFNSQYFSEPSFRMEMSNPELMKRSYGYDASITHDSKLAIAMYSPMSEVKSLTDVQAGLLTITTEGKSSKVLLGTGVIAGISEPTGKAGLAWVKSDKFFKNAVSSYLDTRPGQLTFITEGASFVDPSVDVALSPSTGVNDSPVAGVASQVSIYPNPVKSDFSVKTSVATGEVRVTVYSVAGNEVLSVRENLSNGEVKLSLPFEAATGNYVVKVQDAKTNEVIGTAPMVVAK